MASDGPLNETDRKTVSPKVEPEYVGAHSALVGEACENYHVGNVEEGATPPRRCKNDATHTVVMADGNGLHEVAMCDEHGEPEDVEPGERKWSGRVRT